MVKGGGYLFIDSARGEYAGALELKFLTWSIKAIGLLSTKRPDGSDGWSLLLFVFGQFNVHIAFGIFWTGVGGMIGLHHRSDVDALSAGMRTGALDDVLFPKNPVADAPRIINRYRTLFPVAEGNLLIGPMLELSFSAAADRVRPARADLRRAQRARRPGPATLSKVVLVGQVLVQLPPRDTGVPAILKLLIDVVGFYDGDTRFLLIRARLRDSFVGIEGFAKLDLAGELLVAVQFGPKSAFVLSAGGFHPRYVDLPERVPRDLDKLRVSFKLGPVSLSIEHYFAVTPNSVQAGQKASLKADFGVAKIEASLGWDALLYLSPRFFFVVDLEFKAKVKAFGRDARVRHRDRHARRPRRVALRRQVQLLDPVVGQDGPVPRALRRGPPGRDRHRLARPGAAGRARQPRQRHGRGAGRGEPGHADVVRDRQARPSGRAAGGPPAGGAARPAGRAARHPRAGRRAAGRDRGDRRAQRRDAAQLRARRPSSSPAASSSTLSDDEKLTGTDVRVVPGRRHRRLGRLRDGRRAWPATWRPGSRPCASTPSRRASCRSGRRRCWRSSGRPTRARWQASKLGAAARSDRAEAALRVASPLAASSVGVDEPPLALVGAGIARRVGASLLGSPPATIAVDWPTRSRRPSGGLRRRRARSRS